MVITEHGFATPHGFGRLADILTFSLLGSLLHLSSVDPLSWGSKFFAGRRRQLLLFVPQGMSSKSQALQLAVHAYKRKLGKAGDGGGGHMPATLLTVLWAVSSLGQAMPCVLENTNSKVLPTAGNTHTTLPYHVPL